VPKFATERRVSHAAESMFALVADVDSYPAFVPLCQALVVRARERQADRETLVADMTVAYGPFRETFATQVALDRPKLTITSANLGGPFHHLDSLWSFAAEGAQACVVRFSIDYEFRSRLLGAAMGSVFDIAFRKFASAFEARADAVYGRAPVGTTALPHS
jgi:coenzyme Q-binding protein COQ10